MLIIIITANTELLWLPLIKFQVILKKITAFSLTLHFLPMFFMNLCNTRLCRHQIVFLPLYLSPVESFSFTNGKLSTRQQAQAWQIVILQVILYGLTLSSYLHQRAFSSFLTYGR